MGISALVASAATAVGASAATAAVVGSVVSGAVIGAGVSGAIAAVTGGDVGDAMMMGALTGGLAGPVSGAIASVAPSAAAAGSMANAVATGAVLGGGTALATGGDVLTGAALGGVGAGVGKYVGDALGIGSTPTGSAISPEDLAVNNATSSYGPTNPNLGGYVGSAVDDAATGMGALNINATNQNILNSPLMQGGTGATSAGTGVLSQPLVPTTFTPRVDAAGILYDALDNPMGFMDDAGAMRNLAGDIIEQPVAPTAPTTTAPTTGSNTLADEFVDLTNENILNSPVMQGGTGATSPGTGILKPFVDDLGNLIDESGNAIRNLSGNFVDRTGMVYDEMGNPVARIAGSQPGVDYTGILNPGGTITRLDGGDVIDMLGQPVRAGTSNAGTNFINQTNTDILNSPLLQGGTGATSPGIGQPVTSVPVSTPGSVGATTNAGTNFINQTNNDILNSPLMQGGTGATSPGIGQQVNAVPVGSTGVVPTTQTFGGGGSTGGSGSNFGIPPSAVLPISAGVMSGITTPPRQTPGAPGETPWSWGTVPTIVQPGLNPGLYARAVAPYYENAGPNQNQYYWGAHPYAHTIEDLANYNQVPNAPAQPFGPARSAVGGTDRLDINQYIAQYLNPVRQAATVGSQPQFAGAGGTLMPVMPA